MSPLSLILIALLAFVLGFWLTKRLQRQQKQRLPSPPSFSLAQRPQQAASAPINREALNAQVQTLLDRNQKTEAIKLVQEQTGCSLKEAKAYVVNGIAPVGFPDLFAPQDFGAASQISGEAMLKIQRLIATDQRMEAIKLVQLYTRWDLKTAMAYLEQLASRG
ncbi:hypothetical protein [Pseudanabaena sp. FACHB-2040]|uniref:hypothetical protein n=1 Tax=Pseudanabaena sp. FACHB-2040 TaxID=2692859 RepID=UPI001686F174|nr:hypothetical protein [Pseudanabaena sp. FACHB-2040]MBD2259604.1 hypothetical protein [Pseudanabaena sp. FACHB-2040]